MNQLFSKQNAKKLLLVVGLLLLLFFVCDDILMPWFVNRGETVDVPAVVGFSFDRAKEVMDSLSLEAREGDTRTSEVYTVGTVIAQNPQPGTTVKAGRRVYLVISGGEQMTLAPSLKGKTIRDAKFALERNGLKMGSIVYAMNDSFPANTVINQNISPASKLRRGTRVSVVVSQKSVVDKVQVPDVVGKPLVEAGKILANNGLQVGTVNYEDSPNLLPNTVLDQYPRASEFVGYGQTVDLFVVRSGEKNKPPTEN